MCQVLDNKAEQGFSTKGRAERHHCHCPELAVFVDVASMESYLGVLKSVKYRTNSYFLSKRKFFELENCYLGGREPQEGRDICIFKADSGCCTADTNATL